MESICLDASSGILEQIFHAHKVEDKKIALGNERKKGPSLLGDIVGPTCGHKAYCPADGNLLLPPLSTKCKPPRCFIDGAAASLFPLLVIIHRKVKKKEGEEILRIHGKPLLGLETQYEEHRLPLLFIQMLV